MAKNKREIRFNVVYQGLPCEVLARVIDGLPRIMCINVEGDCVVLLEDLDEEGWIFFEKALRETYSTRR